MTVQDLIKQKGNTVYCAGLRTTVSQAATLFLEKSVGSLVVCDQDRATGIFTKNDVLRRYLANPSGFASATIGDEPSRELFSTTLDANLGEVLEEMVRRGIRHVPVLDLSGKAVGIITPIDILLFKKDTLVHENQQLMNYIQGSY